MEVKEGFLELGSKEANDNVPGEGEGKGKERERHGVFRGEGGH